MNADDRCIGEVLCAVIANPGTASAAASTQRNIALPEFDRQLEWRAPTSSSPFTGSEERRFPASVRVKG
jgi:hypothetical protein